MGSICDLRFKEGEDWEKCALPNRGHKPLHGIKIFFRISGMEVAWKLSDRIF